MVDEVEATTRLSSFSRVRIAVFGCVVLLATPVALAGGFHGAIPMSDTDTSETTSSLLEHPNLTVVTAQGGEVGDGADSRVLVFDPATGVPHWQHDGYDTYYDVDPIDNSTLLYVGMYDNGSTYAVEHDWQDGHHRRLFQIPFDSHDVDSLGNGEYAYLDGRNDTAVVYNDTRGEVVWEFDFREHFPPDAGNGPPSDYSGDYTHLNDVVPVDGGSKFLLSPRNFDRVILVDRASKEIEWTLGEEDNYEILNQQHNPSLIAENPPTVLVSDSENDRVVEYRREGGEWRLVWEYRGSLVWPRDADRLPNGNTMIVDSYRAVEVTPDREVVWEADIPRNLYDIERIRLGDEPGGPSMIEHREAFGSPRDERDRTIGGSLAGIEDAFTGLYNTAYWVLPWWLGPVEFGFLLPASLLVVAWANIELVRGVSARTRGVLMRTRRRIAPYRNLSSQFSPAYRPFVSGFTLLGVGLLVVPLGVLSRLFLETGPVNDTIWWTWVPPHVSVALLLLMEGTWRLIAAAGPRRESIVHLHAVVAVATACTGVVFTTIGAASSIGLLAHSNAGMLLTFGIITVFGLLSLLRNPMSARWTSWSHSPRISERDYVSPFIQYAAGLGVVGISVFVLGQGLQTATFPLLYLTLAFVLLVDGDQVMSRANATAGWRPPIRSILTVSRYVARPIWIVVAGALVAKMFGAGAMASVVADVHFFNPITIGVALFVGSRVLDTLSQYAETDVGATSN